MYKIMEQILRFCDLMDSLRNIENDTLTFKLEGNNLIQLDNDNKSIYNVISDEELDAIGEDISIQDYIKYKIRISFKPKVFLENISRYYDGDKFGICTRRLARVLNQIHINVNEYFDTYTFDIKVTLNVKDYTSFNEDDIDW